LATSVEDLDLPATTGLGGRPEQVRTAAELLLAAERRSSTPAVAFEGQGRVRCGSWPSAPGSGGHTLMARGAFPDSHALVPGYARDARQLHGGYRDAALDLLIALGSRFDDR